MSSSWISSPKPWAPGRARCPQIPWPLSSTIYKTASSNREENAESVFALSEKIAKAQNFQEALTLQAHFAQDQMQAYATQMQELQKLIGEALQKAATRLISL